MPEEAPNDFKQGAFYHAAKVVAGQDPRRAAAWFETHRMQAYSAGALAGIAERWARHHDAADLFDWLRSLPAAEGEREDERRAAIDNGFRIWLREAPEEAEAWLDSALPDPDPALDPAVAELAFHLSGSSPALALDWATRIQEEKLRFSSLVRVSRAGWKKDPQAVTAWLGKNEDLPEKVRQRILRGKRGAGAAARPAQPACSLVRVRLERPLFESKKRKTKQRHERRTSE